MEISSKKSLSTRIVVNILTFSILLFLILLGTFYFFSKKTIEQKTQANAIEVSQRTVLQTERVLFSTETILANYLWMLESNTIDANYITTLTKTIVANNPEIMGCAIAFEPSYFSEKGRYFCPYTYRKNDSTLTKLLGNVDYEYFIMDWYQIAKVTKQPYWSEPFFDEGGSDALITSYSIPFFRNSDLGRHIAGVITIDLSLEWFTDIIADVRILESGYAMVLSRHGTIVTHPNEELIMHETIFSYAAETNNPTLRELGRDMLKGHTDNVSCMLDERKMQLFYTPLPSSSWTLVVAFPEKEMYSALRNISIILVLLIVVGLIMMIFVVSKIVKKQIAPLHDFANSAREIANGNFHATLPQIDTQDEMLDLHDSFLFMQNQLSTYIENLKNTTSAKEKIESELRIAREIQMGMIPKIFPPFPNTPQIDLFALLRPAKEVGGDLYDFFLVDDEHLCFAIGDVSGKGVPASLFMAVTRTLLRSTAPNQLSTATIVKTLNNSLASGNESSMFVTFFIGILHLKTGSLTYTNAGHNPPVIIHKDNSVSYFEITEHIPIGLFTDYKYNQMERMLLPGDKIFLYTDGITEAENSDKKLYSDERLIHCLKNCACEKPKGLIEHVAKDVTLHVNGNDQSDDLTMLSIIYFGNKS